MHFSHACLSRFGAGREYTELTENTQNHREHFVTYNVDVFNPEGMTLS